MSYYDRTEPVNYVDFKMVEAFVAAYQAIRNELEDIAGEWDGDWPGIREERAHLAEDAIEKLDEAHGLIADLVNENY